MALHMRQDIRMSQQLVMTPQLQQAIKLLQLSNVELQEYVETEIEKKFAEYLVRRDEKEKPHVFEQD